MSEFVRGKGITKMSGRIEVANDSFSFEAVIYLSFFIVIKCFWF